MAGELRLWELSPTDKAKYDWPCCDTVEAFIVCASSPSRARKLAAGECGNEGDAVWLDPELSTCQLLKTPKEEGIVIRDFFGM